MLGKRHRIRDLSLDDDVSDNGKLKTFNANGSSGKQTLTTGTGNTALETVSTGSGNDALNVATVLTLESIVTGSGNDTLTISDASTQRTAGVRIDLGSGDDTFHANATDALNARSRVVGGSGNNDVLKTTTATGVSNFDSVYSGFEILDVTDSTGAEIYDLDDIEIHRIQIKGGTTTSVTLENAQPRTSLTVTGGDGQQDADVIYNLEGAGNRDSDSITVNVEPQAAAWTGRPLLLVLLLLP